jgi:hypothetical protein
MSYGLQVRNASGVIQLDTTKQGFELVDAIDINEGNTSGSRSYPNLSGATLKVYSTYNYYAEYPAGNDSDTNVTVAYTNGYPTVTWSTNGYWTFGDTMYILIATLPVNYFGFKCVNDAGTVLLTDTFSSYSLLESKISSAVNVMPATNSYASFFFGPAEGDWAFQWHTHEAVFYNVPVGSNPIFLAEIPSYPNGVQIRNVVQSGTTCTVKCIGYGVAPKIFAFIKQTSIASTSSSFGLRLRNASGQITTDTGNGIFCTTHSLSEISILVDINSVGYVNQTGLPTNLISTARSCRTLFEVREPDPYAMFEPDYIRKVYQKVWSKSSATQLRCDSRLFWTTTVFRGSGDIGFSFTSDIRLPILITDENAYI